jgi:hypothetical protein
MWQRMIVIRLVHDGGEGVRMQLATADKFADVFGVTWWATGDLPFGCST